MVTAALVIAGFAVGGLQVLSFFDVSVPALQGAGGLLLLLVAVQLLTSSYDDAEAALIGHVEVPMVPLGTPLSLPVRVRSLQRSCSSKTPLRLVNAGPLPVHLLLFSSWSTS